MHEDLILSIRSERRWHSKCLGILALHTLQQATKENTRGIKWRVQDTANLLQLSIGYVSESLALAKAIAIAKNKYNMNGELEKMTRDQALRVIKEWKDLDAY